MAVFGTNLSHSQRFNRRVVLETVRLFGPLSRAEVARRTGLSAQTVTNIVDQLKPGGLLVEQQRRTGSRGQPPIDLMINPDGAYSFGISFDHRRLVVVLINLGGEIVDQVEFPVRQPTPAVILPLVDAAVHEILADRAIPFDRVYGAGLVMPVLIANGSPTTLGPSSVPEWRDYPVADDLANRLKIPVFLDNDATAGAIGEVLYGAAKRLADFFYIYLGVGIGGGIILSGRPYRGAYGMAGEIAHLVSEPGGRPCPCGNRGCLERYASLSAAFAAVTRTEETFEPIDIAVLEEAFAAGDPNMLAWLDDSAARLRNAIVTIENLLDPQAVILGGIVPEPILSALMERIEPLPPSVSSRHADTASPRLVRAESGGIDTHALGAASLAIFDSMSPHPSLLTMDGETEEEPRPGRSAAASHLRNARQAL